MNRLVCKRCERDLPESDFKPDTRYKRGFASWCGECHRERNREWYRENKKHHHGKVKKWRKANYDKALEICRRHNRRNKVARAESHAQWAKKNRALRNASSARRKAAKLRATPKWASKKKISAIYLEAKRLEAFTGIPMHVDHIVPLQGENVCGLHWEKNLQIIPASVNVAKHNKWDEAVEEAYRQPDMFVERPAKAHQEALSFDGDVDA